MSLFQCSFFSKTLCTTTKLLVCLPSPRSSEVLEMPMNDVHSRREKKVLYLLHGMFEDETIWIRRSNVERYASEKNIALVMPYGENSYYTDMVHGGNYFTFLTEELPQFIQNSFNLKTDRKNTAIAGLSMGGYGACKLAFLRPDLFGAFASISGALDMECLAKMAQEIGMLPLVRNIIGDPDRIPRSDSDLFTLVTKVMETDFPIPKGYISCGIDDEACYQMNQKFKQFLQGLNYPVQYFEGAGGHEWDFWEKEIRKVLDWLLVVMDA